MSIRRFIQGLILFPELVPQGEAKKVRRRLKKLMNLTSEIRNRDIALEHLAQSHDGALKDRLGQDRDSFSAQFAKAIRRLARKDSLSRWRSALELDVP